MATLLPPFLAPPTAPPIVSESETTGTPVAETWTAILDTLRRRSPGQKDSVLFCTYKLQQNPDLSLRDFRAEAELYGIPMAGRALHSARVLLGLEQPTPPRAKAVAVEPVADEAPRRRRPRIREAEPESSIEDQVMSAVRHIQSAAGEEADKLRAAMRQAIALLQRALGE